MKTPIIYVILYYLTVTIEGFAGGVGIYRYKKLSKPLRYLVWLLTFWFLMSIIEFLVDKLLHIHNIWLLHYVTFIETIFTMAIFYQWRTSKINGLLYIVSTILFLIIWVIGKFTIETMEFGDNFTVSISYILIISFIVYLMLHIMREDNISLTNDARFWVASGFCIYFSGTFLLFALFNFMLSIPREIMQKIFVLNWLFTIISDAFFVRSFFCKPINAGIIHQSQSIANL
ncbi:MAG: hypothetical protein EHM64_16100 [Ignavibacteriae bacterium]|nr:MAG: hypothetical protein EHM64_16100 [Ignavibacteriota bacterium]